MKTRRFLVLCTLALAGGACGTGAHGVEPSSAVRDSAGVRIVESHGPGDDLATWEVGERPAVAIGVAEGAPEYQLSAVRGAVRLPDGGIAVGNGHSRELRFYDASGRFVKSAGRQGSGPGEFQGLDAVVAYRGDSLAVWDSGPRRFSVFGPDGGFGRTATVQGLTSVTARLQASFADGSLLLEPTGSAEDYLNMTTGERRDTVAYLRFAADGAFADTLGRRASREYLSVRAGDLIMRRSILFGRGGHVAAGGGRAFLGESDSYRIDAVDGTGALVMSIRRPGDPRPVERAELARAREEAEENRRRMQALVPGPTPPAAAEELPARSTVPAFDRLVVDADGNLWVRDFLASSGDVPRWSVFDPEGRWIASVETPAGLEVYQIGPDWILGRWRDDMDVEYVHLYPFRRG